jgi:hypothetical protein
MVTASTLKLWKMLSELTFDYAMLVKLYGVSNESPESRYSAATCIGCRAGVLAGNPDPDYISTSFVERQKLSMRMGMRRFTRLTNGISKKLENHGHILHRGRAPDASAERRFQFSLTLPIS